MSKLVRILLVEDSEHDLLAFERSLRNGTTVYEVTNVVRAEEAITLLQENLGQWDLVVADHKLPGMAGLDFCLEVRRREWALPLIMLTGGGSEELAAIALKSGVDDYVVKDPARGYLRLLPVVIPQVLRKVQDRTARLVAEQALAESEARYRAVVEDQSELVTRFTGNGILTFVNDAACRFTGMTRAELLGCSFIDFHPEENRKLLIEKISKLTPENPLLIDEQMIARNGTWFCFEWKNQAFFDLDGNLREVQGVGRDITERKKAEEEKERLIKELQEALERVKTLSGLLPICASCKMIRNDDGYWQQVEVYIRDRSEVEFTHGLCPHCMHKLYPEIADRLEKKKSAEENEREEWEETLSVSDAIDPLEDIDSTGSE